MKEKKIAPRRRFKDFTKEWNLNKLENMGKFGKTYSYSRAQEGDGEYHHIHYGDIHVKYTGFITKNTIVPSLSVQGEFDLLKENDVVIADASEDYVDLGKTIIIQQIGNKKIIAGLHTFKFTPNENLNSKFYLYYSQTNLFKKFSYKTGTGISVFGISKANIKKMQLNTPEQEEQQKIGKFFKHLDQMISLEQYKLEKTKALKFGYLAEMFPTEGEQAPKRRFAGFTDEWKQEKLNKVADYRSGKAHERNVVDSGKYIIVNSKFVSTNGRVKKFSDVQIESLKKGELAFVLSDIPNGKALAKIFLIEDDRLFTLNQRVAGISPKENTDSYFLKELMNRNNYFLKFDGGVGQTNLSNSDVKNFESGYPCFEEQQAIGMFFKKLDDKITNQQQKLDKLKEMKQAYLEEMFV
ncbi:restriction endonuclease subunit S [Carnobacterium sp. TMP28]|uniref:restriction endonuclease subunit S n=1 Tax=Carnobacterium sp. TMP28 TaxID=3397060 RepID=UPI0039E00F95